MLRGAEALEAAVDHDGEPRAQRLALLHAVRRQHHASAGALGASYGTPYLEVSPPNIWSTLYKQDALCR